MEIYLLFVIFLIIAAGLLFFFSRKCRYYFMLFIISLLLLLALYSLAEVELTSVSVFYSLRDIGLAPLIFSAHPYGMISVFGILLVGALSLLYGLEVTKVSEQAASLCALAGAIGILLSDNFITLFLFWELLTFSATALILLKLTPHALRMGYRFLTFHLVGEMLFLLGILQQYSATGSFALAVPEAGLIFFILAIGFKAAFLPFHVWIAWGYTAASFPVSVILAGLTTKIGVYAVARILMPDMNIALMGALMAVFGVVCALLQKNLRYLLSYHIISQVGYMIAGVAIGSSLGVDGGLLHMVNHMLYKALLFMSAGALFFATGTEDLDELCRKEKNVPAVWKAMFVIFAGALVGALAISGVPPFNGYVSKCLLKGATYGMGAIEWLLLVAAVGTVASFCKFVYFGFIKSQIRVRRDIPITMQAAIISVAVLCLFLGVRPQLLFSLLPYSSSLAVYSTGSLASALQPVGVGVILFIILRKSLERGIYPPAWLSAEYLIYLPVARFALKACRFVNRLDKGLDYLYGRSGKVTRGLAQKTAQFDGAINKLYETSGNSARKIAQQATHFDKELDETYKKAGVVARKTAEGLDFFGENSGKSGDLPTRGGSSIWRRLQWKTGELDTKNLNFDSLLLAIMLAGFLFALIYYAPYF